MKQRFNSAPTWTVPVVRPDETGNRIFTYARWEPVPSWVKDPAQLQHPGNAKAGTAAIKPMLRHVCRKSSVLVSADAFYEWAPEDGNSLACIGSERVRHLYGRSAFTILTTHANVPMERFTPVWKLVKSARAGYYYIGAIPFVLSAYVYLQRSISSICLVD